MGEPSTEPRQSPLEQQAATSSLAAVLQVNEEGQQEPPPHELVPDGQELA